MCLMFLYLNPDPRPGQYSLVLVNNRDEEYSRPTSTAHFWDSGILAGMDLQKDRGNGTWLGVGRDGRLGCLLNVMQPPHLLNTVGAPRGLLVVDFLQGTHSAQHFLQQLSPVAHTYNPFNLVLLEPQGNHYQMLTYNSNTNSPQVAESGCHGFGNSPLDQPFVKVVKGRERLGQVVAQWGRTQCEEQLLDQLFLLMQDTTYHFPDAQLSQQGDGYPPHTLQAFSSNCVSMPSYGTRTTTAVLVDHSGRVLYREKNMKEPIQLDNIQWQDNTFTFTLNTPPPHC